MKKLIFLIENDTISCRVEINHGGINFYDSYGYSNDSYTVTDEGELDGYDGVFICNQSNSN